MITEKEAEALCNSVEIKLVKDSFPKGIKKLTPKKIQTRIKNSLKSSEYWNHRYLKLYNELEQKRQSGKIVPLLPELKMETFKKKSQLFKECAERFKAELEQINKKQSIQSLSENKLKSRK